MPRHAASLRIARSLLPINAQIQTNSIRNPSKAPATPPRQNTIPPRHSLLRIPSSRNLTSLSALLTGFQFSNCSSSCAHSGASCPRTKRFLFSSKQIGSSAVLCALGRTHRPNVLELAPHSAPPEYIRYYLYQTGMVDTAISIPSFQYLIQPSEMVHLEPHTYNDTTAKSPAGSNDPTTPTSN